LRDFLLVFCDDLSSESWAGLDAVLGVDLFNELFGVFFTAFLIRIVFATFGGLSQ